MSPQRGNVAPKMRRIPFERIQGLTQFSLFGVEFRVWLGRRPIRAKGSHVWTSQGGSASADFKRTQPAALQVIQRTRQDLEETNSPSENHQLKLQPRSQ